MDLRTLTATALLLLLPVAAPSLDAAPVASDAARVEFHGCRTQFAAFPVPRVLLSVPPEFQTTPFSVVPTTHVGSVPVYLQRCARAETDAGWTVEDVVQAWLMIWVAPPEEWRLPGGGSHYWVVRAGIPDARLAQLYGAWGLDQPGSISLATSQVGEADAWVDVAEVDGLFGLRMVNANAQPMTPWAGVQARYFGRGANGAIHAVDHREPGGMISGIQPAAVQPIHHADPLLPVEAGLGRTFANVPGQPAWSFAPAALPPLP